MLSPAVVPRAQPSPGSRTTVSREKENACRRVFENPARLVKAPPLSPCVENRSNPRAELKQRRLRELQICVERDAVSTPLRPCVRNRSPLLGLKQRRLRELQKGFEDQDEDEERGSETVQHCGEEISARRVEQCGEEGMDRNQDKKLVDENERVKESRKRRFGDIDTHANVAERRDMNEKKKRLHKHRIASTPGVMLTTSKETPNPFDPGFPGSTSKTETHRPNPFDNPSQPTTTSAAPIRSYRRSSQVKHLPRTSTSLVNNPPVRELVSYADLWEGVSSIDSHHNPCTAFEWTYDEEAPMYDFLYHGSWKRRSGSSVVSVAKRKRVFWRGDCWYGGWCRIGACARRKRAYHDLDCPHLEGLIVGKE